MRQFDPTGQPYLVDSLLKIPLIKDITVIAHDLSAKLSLAPTITQVRTIIIYGGIDSVDPTFGETYAAISL